MLASQAIYESNKLARSRDEPAIRRLLSSGTERERYVSNKNNHQIPAIDSRIFVDRGNHCQACVRRSMWRHNPDRPDAHVQFELCGQCSARLRAIARCA